MAKTQSDPSERSLKARTAESPTSKYGSQHGDWMVIHARTHLELDHEMRPSMIHRSIDVRGGRQESFKRNRLSTPPTSELK